MPNLFVSKYSQSDEQFYYVAGSTVETKARANLDFGVKDKKGRSLGMFRSVRYEVVTLEEGEHNPRNYCLYKVDAPLAYFIGFAQQTRDGVCFGGSCITVRNVDRAALEAELDLRIERARQVALKKYGA